MIHQRRICSMAIPINGRLSDNAVKYILSVNLHFTLKDYKLLMNKVNKERKAKFFKLKTVRLTRGITMVILTVNEIVMFKLFIINTFSHKL